MIRMRSRLWLCILLLSLSAGLLRAQDLPAPPARHFVDEARLVSAPEADQLAEQLYAFEQRTGIQFVVAVLPEADAEISDYGNRLFAHWKIGDAKNKRGVLFLVLPNQRASRLEVAYGLEEALPDISAGRILREMKEIPRDPAAARLQFVMIRVAQAIAPNDPLAQGQMPAARPQRTRRPQGLGLLGLVGILALLGLLGGGRRGGGMAPFIIGSILGSSLRGGGGGFGGGGGGFGGGGFSGGGDFSGGGGASGGW